MRWNDLVARRKADVFIALVFFWQNSLTQKKKTLFEDFYSMNKNISIMVKNFHKDTSNVLQYAD